MSANPLPSSSSANLIQGSFDYFYLEERKSTGAALDTPYTPPVQKISIAGQFDIDWKDDSAAIADIQVKTPAFGRGYIAAHAADVSAAAASAPPNLKVTILFKESDGLHLSLPALLKGRYYNLIIPGGVRGATTTDLAFFVKFDTTTKMVFQDNKETDFSMVATVQNNSVSDTCTLPTDTNIHAVAMVIGANAGYLIVETA